MTTSTRTARVLGALALLGSAVVTAGTAQAGVPADTQPPTTPHLISAIGGPQTGPDGRRAVVLQYTVSSDDQSVLISYVVYANGRKVGEYELFDTQAVYSCDELNPDYYACDNPWEVDTFTGTEVFTVTARDQAGNESAPSNGLVPSS